VIWEKRNRVMVIVAESFPSKLLEGIYRTILGCEKKCCPIDAK
jgi:hypothetical protein